MLRKPVQAQRQPVTRALLQYLEAQPVGLDEFGLHVTDPVTFLAFELLHPEHVLFGCSQPLVGHRD